MQVTVAVGVVEVVVVEVEVFEVVVLVELVFVEVTVLVLAVDVEEGWTQIPSPHEPEAQLLSWTIDRSKSFFVNIKITFLTYLVTRTTKVNLVRTACPTAVVRST